MNISVIITSFNEVEYIRDAIESVLYQTLQPDEIVVVDAGSTDGTKDIIREYNNEYQKLDMYSADSAMNIPEMRNFGLKNSTGDFITMLDGDDRFRENKLEREYEMARASDDAGIVFSNVAYVDEYGDTIKLWADETVPPTGEVLFENVTRAWPNRSLYRDELVSSDVIDAVGGYDGRLRIYEDWDFKIRSAAATNVAYCPEVLTEYRQHDQGISKRVDHKTHKGATQLILDKSLELISRECTGQEAEHAIGFLKSKILRHGAYEMAENGDYLEAYRQYISHLQHNPSATKEYKQHLHFFLPFHIYERIKSATLSSG